MKPNNITVLAAGIDNIPSLPAIVGRITQAIADPESSARDLMRIISPDQALTLKILKIANSAFYGRIREVRSLDQAIMVLGFEEIRNLVLSSAVFNNFRKLKSCERFDVGKFWEHSFLCALAARTMAHDLKINESEMFVAGLIHDIGKLVVCMVMPRQLDLVVEMTGNSCLETSVAEQQVIGISHAEVGIQLVKKWLLPEDLSAAVGFHHQPDAIATQSVFPIAIHLADLLSHMIEPPYDSKADQFHEACFAPKIVSVARSHGMLWNQERLENYRIALEAQKEDQINILKNFLS